MPSARPAGALVSVPRFSRSWLRELGRRNGYDLAGTIAPDKVKLDPVQAWLIQADVTVRAVRKLRSSQRGRALPAGGPTARTAFSTDGCDNFDQAVEALQKRISDKIGSANSYISQTAIGKIADKIASKLISRGTRWSIRNLPRWAVRGAWVTGNAAAAANVALDGLHGMLLAYSVRVQAVSEKLPETHWGHDGDGDPLVFGVSVTMLDDYGDVLVKCGKLLGYPFPKKGGVPGVSVLWDQAESRLIPNMGTWPCFISQPTCAAVTRTDGSGIASIKFQPNREPFPGLGLDVGQSGVVNGIAFYQSGIGGGALGAVAQFLFPKSDGTRWFVSYHQPRGFKLDATLVTGDQRVPRGSCCKASQSEYRLRLRTCGSEPYGPAWNGDLTFVQRENQLVIDNHDGNSNYFQYSETPPATVSRSYTFVSRQATTQYLWADEGELSVELLETDPPSRSPSAARRPTFPWRRTNHAPPTAMTGDLFDGATRVARRFPFAAAPGSPR